MDQRTEFVLKAMKTENFRGLCREYGISAKTGYKWKERFLQHGLEGLAELSRRPSSTPAKLPEDTVCEIICLKNAHPHWGPEKLRAVYERKHPKRELPSISSFHRVLDRAGLVQKKKKRLAKKGGRIHTGRKAESVNDVWTVDFKGWWRDPEGRRCEPLTVRDEYSRYLLSVEKPPSGRTEDIQACFERLFQRYGLPGAIRSDNGPPFASTAAPLGLSRLSAWWVVLGIGLERGRPGCPQDNGAHERMHLDIERELAKAGCSAQASFDVWRQEFNTERPHQSLGNRCPADLYKRSKRRFSGTPDDLDYPGWDTRKIGSRGQLRINGNRVLLSTSLVGWSVGITPSTDDTTDIFFAKLRLGHYDPATSSFQRAGTGPLKGAGGVTPDNPKP